jgi:thymidylate kinase
VWATLVAALDAASQRSKAVRGTARGRVVVFDRHALDSIVRLRFLYGSTVAYPLQRRLVDLIAPQADFAYFLDIAPETSLARKDDIWSLAQLQRHADLYREELGRLGVRRLDGERPRDELCAEIALEVWLGLRGSA